jgi:sulfur-oxidizing protein SoxY
MDRTGLAPGRRRALAAAGAALAAAALARGAAATPEAARALLAGLAKGTPREGRVTIGAPEIAENGSAVPLTVRVDSPMTQAEHVRAIHVVAEGNPAPGVASFRLGPLSGRAEVQFRARLAASQRVIAVAELSDGSLWMASRDVKVTVGGCS